jgi:PleD family two-component response regulator
LKLIAGRDYEYEAAPEQKTLRFTSSGGVAELTSEDTEATLLGRAAEALYESKRRGKNRVTGKKRFQWKSIFSGRT